jgi:CRISPR-associated endoribonuclease Cas2 subtype I-E
MMTVITEQITPALRGWLTTHLLEVQPHVFVGVVSARVRQQIINEVRRHIKPPFGGATIVYAATTTGQALEIITVGQTTYVLEDFDGLPLMMRPTRWVSDTPIR